MLPEGDYYLVLYVDDTLEVSEFNEVNNWIAVPIFIEEPNEPPVATDTTFVTDEDTPLSDTALPASDPDGDELTFTITSAAASGTVELSRCQCSPTPLTPTSTAVTASPSRSPTVSTPPQRR